MVENKKVDNYTVKLRELNHIHHLALEQYKKSFPRHSANVKNVLYRKEYEKDKSALTKVNAKLFLLENEVNNELAEQEKQIKKSDRKIKIQKKVNDVLSNLQSSQDDKDKALIEMAKDLKDTQSERLMYLFDMGLGISLLGYFIYKKTRSA